MMLSHALISSSHLTSVLAWAFGLEKWQVHLQGSLRTESSHRDLESCLDLKFALDLRSAFALENQCGRITVPPTVDSRSTTVRSADAAGWHPMLGTNEKRPTRQN
ncbi:hypothetical protein B0H13DRAFT_1890534 [Mycena leptocephala]|nr:hypothetical protein B0H13DRAFT_1923542 [Mycena leptocephala]KAJ7883094.1 hypothetical protein B0H13DRAFT_1890534 [Mycena leptocephala]